MNINNKDQSRPVPATTHKRIQQQRLPQRARVAKRTNAETVAQLSADIHELSLLSARLFAQKIKGMGLTRTQWMVLERLHREGEQSQTQLANSLSMATPPIGKVIDKLQEVGWVSRRRNPRDRRENLVSPTRAVDPLVEPLNLIAQDIAENAMIGLTNDDRQNLALLLDKVRSNLLKMLEENP